MVSQSPRGSSRPTTPRPCTPPPTAAAPTTEVLVAEYQKLYSGKGWSIKRWEETTTGKRIRDKQEYEIGSTAQWADDWEVKEEWTYCSDKKGSYTAGDQGGKIYRKRVWKREFCWIVEGEKQEIYIHENQRWFPIKGWSSEHRLPSDKQQWTDMYGQPVKKEYLEPPSRGSWVSEWEIRYQGADREGWEYAHANHHSYHLKQKPTDCIRRRKWAKLYRTDDDVEYIPGDSEDRCGLCGKPFTVLRHEHHCRLCHIACCAKCSGTNVSVPGYETEQRACDRCCKKHDVPVGEWYVGKSLHSSMKKARAARMVSGVASHDTTPAKYNTDSESFGTLHLTIRECRSLSAAWVGDAGTPNPHVEVSLSGSFVKTPGKTQTRNPKWSKAESHFQIPTPDPTATVFFSVYDVSAMGVYSQAPLGRAAIPLPDIDKEKGFGSWIELLPPGEPEVNGYEKDPPSTFRTVSPVSEKLGMHDPKKSLGFIFINAEWKRNDAPLYGILDTAYWRGKPGEGGYETTVEQLPQQFLDIHKVKDNAARLHLEFGLPTLLKFLWVNQTAAFGSVPVIAYICFCFAFWQTPMIICGLTILNGVLAKVRGPVKEYILYEENNPFGKPSL
eukprot:TRINITY_DN20798_c1_g1_i1.p1 TRINITY_DN20798_c1_g1~~TRINITY_DN20798_c1_g1_i1.p1  ORF type:complete len:612 (+),score=75.89 TRINITY_DN20798_c1_g1_i1:86-1921(+)